MKTVLEYFHDPLRFEHHQIGILITDLLLRYRLAILDAKIDRTIESLIYFILFRL
jgi:hypothetical protein